MLGAPSEGSLPSVRVVAESGPAAPILLAHAEGAALLVVGCRSRSRIAGMVLGSVALDCVVNAHSPVMVVRPPHGSRHPVGG